MNCPICFEELMMLNNMITTECGHQFHASCLMKHAVYNGFSCPCCRAIMAEKENKQQNTGGEDSDDDTYDESDDDNTNSDTDSITSSDYDDTVISEHINIHRNEYVLRGFRFFMNRIDCVEDSEEDIDDESEDEQYDLSVPSPEYLIKHLQDQNVTLEQLITSLLVAYRTEYKNYIRDLDSDLMYKMNEVMYKMNRLIYNYNKESFDDITSVIEDMDLFEVL